MSWSEPRFSKERSPLVVERGFAPSPRAILFLLAQMPEGKIAVFHLDDDLQLTVEQHTSLLSAKADMISPTNSSGIYSQLNEKETLMTPP